MSVIKEFREFALKGNVVDLAIAVIIGAAFSAIISSFVEDVITPLLLTPALRAANVENLEQLSWGAVKYGKFLAAIIKFIMVSMVLFALIKALNKMKRKKEDMVTPSVPELSLSEKLLTEIRAHLKAPTR